MIVGNAFGGRRANVFIAILHQIAIHIIRVVCSRGGFGAAQRRHVGRGTAKITEGRCRIIVGIDHIEQLIGVGRVGVGELVDKIASGKFPSFLTLC